MQRPVECPSGADMSASHDVSQKMAGANCLREVSAWTVDDVNAWVSSTPLPLEAAGLLQEHAITGQVLESLCDQDLITMGLHKFGWRRQLLLSLRELCGSSGPSYFKIHTPPDADSPSKPSQPRSVHRPEELPARSSRTPQQAEEMSGRAGMMVHQREEMPARALEVSRYGQDNASGSSPVPKVQCARDPHGLLWGRAPLESALAANSYAPVCSLPTRPLGETGRRLQNQPPMSFAPPRFVACSARREASPPVPAVRLNRPLARASSQPAGHVNRARTPSALQRCSSPTAQRVGVSYSPPVPPPWARVSPPPRR